MSKKVNALLYKSGAEPGARFAMRDRANYVVGDGGNFVNVDKDRRTKKERRRDADLRRRAERSKEAK